MIITCHGCPRISPQQKDLLDVFKHKAMISEILHRKRPLSVAHIRGLARRFRVSADVFI